VPRGCATQKVIAVDEPKIEHPHRGHGGESSDCGRAANTLHDIDQSRQVFRVVRFVGKRAVHVEGPRVAALQRGHRAS